MTTFEIKQAYRDLEDMVSSYDPETGEMTHSDEYISSYTALLDEERNEKIESIEYLKRENKAKAEALASEIKRLQGRKASLELTVERLTELQDTLLGGEKLKTDKFTFSYRRTKSVEVPEKVNPDLSKEWVNVKYTWDKKKIKEELERTGMSYEEYGIRLVEKTTLSVR